MYNSHKTSDKSAKIFKNNTRIWVEVPDLCATVKRSQRSGDMRVADIKY